MHKVTAGLWLALALSGCSTSGIVSGVTGALTGGSKPEVTAQLGAENTKQTLGLNSKVQTEDKQELGDIKANTASVTQQKTQRKSQSEVGSIAAESVQITTSDSRVLLVSYALGLLAVVALACLLVLLLRKDKED